MKTILKYLLLVVILSSCSIQSKIKDEIRDNLKRSVYITDDDKYALEFEDYSYRIVTITGDLVYIEHYSIELHDVYEYPESKVDILYDLHLKDSTIYVQHLYPPDSIKINNYLFRLKGVI